MLVILLCVYVWPVFRVLRDKRRDRTGRTSSSSQDSKEEQLAAFMASKKAAAFFADFLKSEFSLENLMFTKAATKHKEQFSGITSLDASKCLASVTTIFNTYVSHTAALQVNMSAECFDELRDTIAQCEESFQTATGTGTDPASEADFAYATQQLVTVFDAAIKEITSLIANDSFPRFLKSKQFEIYRTQSSAMSSRNNTRESSKSGKSAKESAKSKTSSTVSLNISKTFSVVSLNSKTSSDNLHSSSGRLGSNGPVDL